VVIAGFPRLAPAQHYLQHAEQADHRIERVVAFWEAFLDGRFQQGLHFNPAIGSPTQQFCCLSSDSPTTALDSRRAGASTSCHPMIAPFPT
jgi:hypothetical protein